MSTDLRGPPRPRGRQGPDPPDARTFLTFAIMMAVITTVIIGIGGFLHGFPTFSEPAGMAEEGGESAPAGADTEEESEGSSDESIGSESTEEGSDDGGESILSMSDTGGENGNDTADEDDDRIDIETEEQNGPGFGDG